MCSAPAAQAPRLRHIITFQVICGVFAFITAILSASPEAANGGQTTSDTSATTAVSDCTSAAIASQPEDAKILEELLKLKTRDGRDNALIHYILAGQQLPNVPNKIQTDMIKSVLRKGWDNDSIIIKPYMEAYAASFAEVRKGAALDYARGIGFEMGPQTPLPSFAPNQMISKMMCVEGRYLEKQGKYREALDDYLTVLTLGRDFTSPGNLLISYRIGIACELISLQQIQQLVVSGKLSPDDLTVMIERIQHIIATQESYAAIMGNEKKFVQWLIDQARKDPKYMKIMISGNSGGIMQCWLNSLGFGSPESQLDCIQKQHDEIWDFMISEAKKPYYQRDRKSYDKKLQSMLQQSNLFIRIAIPNFSEAEARALVALSEMRLAVIKAALELFKDKNRNYPDQLARLAPGQIKEIPTDPFTGKDFIYQPAPDTSSYTLYGAGPDMHDDKAQITYDPTNGALSAGDIVTQINFQRNESVY